MRLCHQCGASVEDAARFCSACGASSDEAGGQGASDPLVGRVVGGSYLLQEVVGVGGMGRVYKAEQSTLGRTVAVKVIHPHLLGDEQTVHSAEGCGQHGARPGQLIGIRAALENV